MRIFNRRALGSAGEARGEGFLRKNGYTVLERNYRTGHGEIDLIARDGADIVFVEVKLRRTDGYGLPQEAVDARKQQKIVRSALQYAKAKNLMNENLRFDVLAIGPEPGRIEHIKHAFQAPERYFY